MALERGRDLICLVSFLLNRLEAWGRTEVKILLKLLAMVVLEEWEVLPKRMEVLGAEGVLRASSDLIVRQSLPALVRWLRVETKVCHLCCLA